MPIKEKTLKKCHSDKRLTIDVIHNNKINEFKKKQKEYDEYKKRLSELNINDLCDERVLYYQNKIKEYEYNQKNNEDDYYLDNGILLDQYYNEIYHLKDKKKNTNETIMNWFKDNSSESDKSIQDGSKEDIITEYMSKIDDKFCLATIDFNTLLEKFLEKKILSKEDKFVLRINCEGAESEIIKSLIKKKIKPSIILGSLEDIKKIFGLKAYKQIQNLLKKNKIPYRYFKGTDPSTWNLAKSYFSNI